MKKALVLISMLCVLWVLVGCGGKEPNAPTPAVDPSRLGENGINSCEIDGTCDSSIDYTQPRAMDMMDPSRDTTGNGINDCEEDGTCDDSVDYTQPMPTMHPSRDTTGNGINDCEEDGTCDDSIDYTQPRPEELGWTLEIPVDLE